MSANDKSYKTQIIVAIIGLIGVICTALFTNWDKIFPLEKKQSPPGGNISAASDPGRNGNNDKSDEPARLAVVQKPAPPPPVKATSLANESIIHAANTSQPDGSGRWDWTIFLDADQNILARIRCVEYTLHPTFPNPVRTVCDPANRFALSSNGWGTFEIKIKVIFKDESIKNLSHKLKFSQG